MSNLLLLGVGKGGGSSAGGTGWAFSATQTSAASSNQYTFSNYAVGSAAANRVVTAEFCWSHTLGSTISSVTIGGVTATLIQQQVTHSTTGRIAVYSAVVPSGTTATVVVNMSTSINGGIGCSVHYGYPSSATPLDSGVQTAAAAGVVTVTNIQIAAGGFLLGFAGGAATASPFAVAWTGDDALVTDSESTAGGVIDFISFHANTNESTTDDDMTSDPAGASSSALIAVSWAA